MSFKEFKQESQINTTTINKLFSKFSTTNNQTRIINTNDDSFSINTDLVFKVSTITTDNYTFRIDNPLNQEVSFENFVIKKIDSIHHFFIYEYTFNQQLENEVVPYDVNFYQVDQNLINIGDFNDFLNRTAGGYCDPIWDIVTVEVPVCHCCNQNIIHLNVCPQGSYLENQDRFVITYSECENETTEEGNNEGNDGTNGELGGGTNGSGGSVGLLLENENTYLVNNIKNCVDLNINQFNWISNNDNIKTNQAINDFIDANNCSIATQNFVSQGITAILNGGEVDWEDRIIYDNSFNNFPCQKKIIGDVYQKDTIITSLFQNIFDNGNTHNINFIANPNWNGVAGTLEQPSNNTNYDITIGNKALTATNLLLATAIVHEALHASLSHIYNYGDEFIVDNLNAGQEPTYLELVYAYMESEVGANAIAQHEFMQNYRLQIAQAVYTWVTTPTTQDGGGFTASGELLTHLQRLAWLGLQTLQDSFEPTEEWSYIQANTPTLADQIEAIIRAEFNDSDTLYYYGWDGTQYNLNMIKKGTVCP